MEEPVELREPQMDHGSNLVRKTFEIENADADFPESSLGLRSERFVLAAILVLVFVLGAVDLFEDGFDGVPIGHIALEGTIILASIFGLVLLARHSFSKVQAYQLDVQGRLLSAREDAKRWRAESASVLQGLGEAISKQFESWHLSAAERDVALLLLKGLSHKEIAEIRGTSERTVRHQAVAVYAKANLVGRVELSAFFLEDLLLPLSDAS